MCREFLADNLMTFLPTLYKKLFGELSFYGVNKQQFELLFLLSLESGRPMTYYGSKMMVSKPNLTVIADKLIEYEYIIREHLQNDRRVIILKLTKKGEEYLKKQREHIKSQLMKRFEVFDINDIKRLNELMEESSRIVSKLDEIK